MQNISRFMIAFFLFIILVVYYFYKTSESESVKIGFVGALTSKYSVLGNAMMNGVLLAFDEIDYKINNKNIEIIFKDDKKNPELNKQIVNEFIENDIKIVIGNVTSTMSKISMSIINKHSDMFMISAASASNEFTGIDDQFFRVHVANNPSRFDSFSKYIIQNNYNKIYGLYDPDNITYTKDYLINFEKSFINNGGTKLISLESTNKSLDTLVLDIKKKNPDMILMCANSVDSAKIIQFLRLKGVTTKIALAEWAMTKSFLENAGKSSEGVIFNIDFNPKSEKPKYKNFVKNYKQKYNHEPSMYAAKAYELAQIIIEMLKKGDERQIKYNLLKQKNFEGLIDKIVFDQYGDVVRTYYTFEVENGEFIKIK
ncbi:ABC transporter substrate-binding protein [Arcobacter roscoffensis]|uniref:ABC transporter substrate-binding protein n=1 Tax=Arcobacter roscoffensis TaxID=2961520 RepID=A0ABY5E540_9BACT|nr:ABC transporter substrate-binding protein [Arcobacter roscoffensis]UTJ05843.1 ABC transporter substrate-binding protein [Arcobacter roscoffensis]